MTMIFLPDSSRCTRTITATPKSTCSISSEYALNTRVRRSIMQSHTQWQYTATSTVHNPVPSRSISAGYRTQNNTMTMIFLPEDRMYENNHRNTNIDTYYFLQLTSEYSPVMEEIKGRDVENLIQFVLFLQRDDDNNPSEHQVQEDAREQNCRTTREQTHHPQHKSHGEAPQNSQAKDGTRSKPEFNSSLSHGDTMTIHRDHNEKDVREQFQHPLLQHEPFLQPIAGSLSTNIDRFTDGALYETSPIPMDGTKSSRNHAHDPHHRRHEEYLKEIPEYTRDRYQSPKYRKTARLNTNNLIQEVPHEQGPRGTTSREEPPNHTSAANRPVVLPAVSAELPTGRLGQTLRRPMPSSGLLRPASIVS
ncbi:hypothetical protein BJ508DRAFT_380102 [Ascobolus immersus RN42]|uniref:Uncharacterized protein n=1 Tax=Ascobolus immersus RN42 TaxID=1160509 RepID=A0A3N4HNX4_ASCIM|nr:hypothetical protein BJ508DRAFT_380102 [Ascobolus immersus RN42]